MTEIPLPPPQALRELFHELLSKGCEVDAVEGALTLSPDVASVIAEYVDGEGVVVGASIADLAFAARSGSALVMMPADDAEQAVAAGELDGDLLDCYKEVANVLARLLNSAASPHLKLRGLFRSGQLIPGELRTVLSSDRRRDFHVVIDEYGDGRVTVIVGTEPLDAVAA